MCPSFNVDYLITNRFNAHGLAVARFEFHAHELDEQHAPEWRVFWQFGNIRRVDTLPYDVHAIERTFNTYQECIATELGYKVACLGIQREPLL